MSPFESRAGTAIIHSGLAAVTSYKATKNIGKLLQEASGAGAKVALILAPAEWEQKTVKLKNLATREEHVIDREKIVQAVRQALG